MYWDLVASVGYWEVDANGSVPSTGSNVVFNDVHVMVTVRTGMLMEKSNSMHQLVRNNPFREALVYLQRHCLIAPSSANIWRASKTPIIQVKLCLPILFLI